MRSASILTTIAIVIGIAATLAVSHAGAGELRIGVIGEGLASTESSTKHDDTTSMILHHVVESLVAYDEQLDVAPMLAESWSVSEDGRSWTFTLRDDVRYHNGETMTAGHVAWNWNRFRDPGRDWGSHCREWYDGSAEAYHRPVTIVSVEGDDQANTVTFRLQFRSSVFPHLIANNHCISGIVHPDSVDEDGGWLRPIGTGPYRLEEANADGSARLERFEAYSAREDAASGLAGGKQATVETLIFRPYETATDALAALTAGEVHFVPDVPLRHRAAVRKADEVRHVIQATPAFHQLIIQSRFDPLLARPEMRRAIAHAIDPAAITRALFGDAVRPNPSVVAVTSRYHSPAHDVGYARDRSVVERLLAEAGYEGETLTIQASRDPYPAFYAVAEQAAAQLREFGIRAEVREVSWPDQDGNYANNEYQMTSMTFSARTDPALMYSVIVGQKADHSWYLWEDNEASALVAMATVVSDHDERQALFDQLHAKMLAWTPTIGIFNYPRLHAMREEVSGYRAWPLAYPRFWLIDAGSVN